MDDSGWRSRRYLPHFDAAQVLQHIVFRLADALSPDLAGQVKTMPLAARMAAADRNLDIGYGSRVLSDARAARIVQDALLHFDKQRYALWAWCVMPTHVHVLVERWEDWPLSGVVHTWKSFTANAINRKLGRSGILWAREYYDRFMRDGDQAETTRAYIEHNPVAAGLCDETADWPWSSASVPPASSRLFRTP